LGWRGKVIVPSEAGIRAAQVEVLTLKAIRASIGYEQVRLGMSISSIHGKVIPPVVP